MELDKLSDEYCLPNQTSTTVYGLGASISAELRSHFDAIRGISPLLVTRLSILLTWRIGVASINALMFNEWCGVWSAKLGRGKETHGKPLEDADRNVSKIRGSATSA